VTVERIDGGGGPPGGHYPGRAPLDAYGHGGFRFAGMSHRGSLVALPSGIWAWEVADIDAVTVATLARVLAEPVGDTFAILLLGTGARHVLPSAAVRRALAGAGLTVEAMSTGAACRTYNVMLAEGRPVGAALIAVGGP
jgi:uncharacterized protein